MKSKTNLEERLTALEKHSKSADFTDSLRGAKQGELTLAVESLQGRTRELSDSLDALCEHLGVTVEKSLRIDFGAGIVTEIPPRIYDKKANTPKKGLERILFRLRFAAKAWRMSK
jgi:hypothetical protein